MENLINLRVGAFAGGVGGAKLAHGLAQVLLPGRLTIIVNTGDDFEYLGLKICPDLDTICYTLAGIANPATGWGRADETWNALESLAELGGPTWFRLGDKDLGTHLERSRLLAMGKSLSQITKELCHFWNLDHAILPVTDNYVPTIVDTDEGVLPFQEYFVKLQCRPKVKGFTFRDVEGSVPAPGVVDALQKSDIVIICPSNPWVSVDPILAIPGVMAALESSTAPIIAVSPIIGGEAVKGPAAKMFKEMGFQPSPLTVAEHYASRQAGGILDGFVLDEVDKDMELAIRDINMETLATGTWMKSISDRQRLAREVLEFGEQLMGRV